MSDSCDTLVCKKKKHKSFESKKEIEKERNVVKGIKKRKNGKIWELK